MQNLSNSLGTSGDGDRTDLEITLAIPLFMSFAISSLISCPKTEQKKNHIFSNLNIH